jgi:hypothetical protein
MNPAMSTATASSFAGDARRSPASEPRDRAVLQLWADAAERRIPAHREVSARGLQMH